VALRIEMKKRNGLIVTLVLLFATGFTFMSRVQQPKPVKKASTVTSTLDASLKSIKASIDNARFTEAGTSIRKALLTYPANAELLKLKRQWVLADYKAHVSSQSELSLVLDRKTSPAKCDAGLVSAASDQKLLQRINYVRRLAGMYDSCVLDPVLNKKAQQAAYMMDVNSQLSHAPKTSWKCYTKDGALAAGSGNLSLGYGFIEALMGQIEDFGPNNGAVGHRRWILNPTNNVFGHGSTDNAMCLYVFGSSNKTLQKTLLFPDSQFVAWPSTDYFPKALVPQRWSFSYKDAEFDQAVVTVNAAGKPLKVVKEKPEYGYALNTLVWQMPAAVSVNVAYSVRVSNVKIYNPSISKYQYKTFTYTVTPVSEE
jgi:hypothetical protein